MRCRSFCADNNGFEVLWITWRYVADLNLVGFGEVASLIIGHIFAVLEA
jgi:hypothetical protein